MGMAMAIIKLKIRIMKTIYIYILILVFSSCSSTKPLQYDTSSCNFDDRILESDKILNFEAVKKEFNKEGYYVYIDNDSIHYSLTYGVENQYWIRKENKIISIEKIISYDKKSLKVINSFSFYKKGSFNIGNEYFYNDKGEVIKTIDHNQYSKYPICYKDIIKIATKKMGKNYIFQALSRDSLSINNDLKYIWHVSMSDSITKSPTVISKYYKIDAKTGEILKQGFVRQI